MSLDSKVAILPEVYDKIMWWVHRSPQEISGFGKVQFIDGVATVTSAYLITQENSSADTEIDAQALSKLMYEKREEEGHMNFWWHSHVNMNVFWSATDYAAIRQIGKQGWVLAIVFNKKEEYRAAIYQGGSEFFPPIWVDDMTMEQASRVSKELADELEAEYTTKCKTKTYTTAYKGYTGSTWAEGNAWCYEKGMWVTKGTEVSYHDKHQKNWKDDDVDAPLVGGNSVGKQLSLLTKTGGLNTGQNKNFTADGLPNFIHSSDDDLIILDLDKIDQLVIQDYYTQMYGEAADEWWDLNAFYIENKDALDQDLDINQIGVIL